MQDSLHLVEATDVYPDACSVRRQLARILRSPPFEKARQLRLLLEFLVEGVLQGSTPRVKEYAVAVEVFGRELSFDPATDNIVRVEARRLRSKLDEYYSDLGWADSIIISLPKGNYAPDFRRVILSICAEGKVIRGQRITASLTKTRDGTLFTCLDLNLNRPAWLWLSEPFEDSDAQRAAVDFSRRIAAITHPNICQVQDAGEFSDRVYTVLVPPLGVLLCDRLKQGPVSLQDAISLTSGIVRALNTIHDVGLVWGGLRPQYVVCDSTVSNAFVLFTNVSSCSACDDVERSPEQRMGHRADVTSDVWAVGAILDQLIDKRGEQPTALAAVHGVAEQCLAESPHLRYQSAQELATALNALEAELEGTHAKLKLPLRTLVAILVLLIVLLLPMHSREVRVTRVLILPFHIQNISKLHEPYSRALVDLLSSRLGRIPNVQLVAAPSPSSPNTEQQSTGLWQHSTAVDYSVEGTLIQSNDQFRATLTVKRSGDGVYIWKEDCSGALMEVFNKFSELAEHASYSMGVVARTPAAPEIPSREILASESLLKGRFSAIDYANTRNTKFFEEAERRLKRALELKPENVDVMIELARLYVSAAYPEIDKQPELFDRAGKLVERALALDRTSASANALRGVIYVETGLAREALPYLLVAMQLKPYDPDLRNYLALAYEAMGFWESSLAELRRASEMDPLLRGIATGGVPLLVRMGRMTEAVRIIDSMEPGADRDLRLGYLYLHTGDPRKAEAVLTRGMSSQTREGRSMLAANLAVAQAMQGRPDAARRALKSFVMGRRYRDESPILLCALSGDKDLLLEQIANNASVRNYRWLIGEPLLRPYRKYPEFQALVRGLYKEWESNIVELQASLPASPSSLPAPQEYLDAR
jgi:tetratricopeptide (TPR) repeat protein